MKKIILPMVAAAFLAACSESNPDANLIAPPGPMSEISSSSVAVVPPASSETVTAPTSSDVVAPASSAAAPGSSAAVAPTSSEVAAPTSSAATTPNPQFTYKVPTLTEANYNPAKDYTFYGAELTGVEQYKYGRFEARMKMAAISGSVSSMFLNYDNSWMKGEEPWNEIDIEVLGKDPNSWQSNILTREANPSINALTASESKPLHAFGFDATQDFHLYAIVWTPEYVAWEIDSVEIRRDTLGMTHGTHADADQVKFLTQPQSLRFNLWASKTPAWTGEFTGIGLPIEQQIDYVRAYTYDTTSKAFTLAWQDDFEGTSLNSDRWSRGNWTMELVEYRVQNVKVSDGMARIILDYEAD